MTEKRITIDDICKEALRLSSEYLKEQKIESAVLEGFYELKNHVHFACEFDDLCLSIDEFSKLKLREAVSMLMNSISRPENGQVLVYGILDCNDESIESATEIGHDVSLSAMQADDMVFSKKLIRIDTAFGYMPTSSP